MNTLRDRWASLLGTIVAVAFGAALISAATLTLAAVGAGDGLRQGPVRYTSVPIVVHGSDDHLPGRPAPPPAGLAASLARVPGVAAAVPDVSFFAEPGGTGHGWASTRLDGSRLLSGRPPSPGEVAVSPGLRRPAGSTLRLLTASGYRNLTVSGVVSQGLYVDDSTAAKWGTTAAIGVFPQPGRSVAAEVRKAAGPGAAVRTGDARRLAEPDADRQQLDDASALLAISAGLAGFVAIFVVASTFAFAVSQRRREFALLRLIGARPRQVRRMVYLEALLTGGVAAALGALLGLPLAAAYGWQLRRAGLVPAGFAPHTRFWPLTIGFGVGLAVALIGSWSAARRAGKAAPAEALRDSVVEKRPMTFLRWLFGLVFLAGAMVMTVLAGGIGGESAIAMTVFLGELLVVAFALLAPVVIPSVVRLVSLPLNALSGAEPLLVRQGALTAVRRVASTAAPVLVTVGVAGSLIGAVATLAKATDDDLRQRLVADVVVVPDHAPGLSAAVSERIAAAEPGAVVSPLLRTTIREAAHGLSDPALGIDPVTLAKTMHVPVSSGSLADLKPGTMTAPDSAGLRVGDRTVVTFADGRSERLKVVAIVSSLQLPALLLPAETVRAHDPSALASAVYVRGGSASATQAAVAPVAGKAVDRETYVRQVAADANASNGLALTVLLGVALAYTGLAIVNTLMMATFERRAELDLLRRTGATPVQTLRVVAGEAALVVLVGVGLAVAATVLSLAGLANALSALGTHAAPAIPWGAITLAAGVCLLLAILATVAPAAALLRPRPPSV